MVETSTLFVDTDGPAATQDLAAALVDCLRDGDLIVLTGDLGAGKTCFTQGLGRGLHIADRITSPTFTLASVYDGDLRLNHLDVYRLDDVGETLDLDLPELLEDGVTVIEWGEQIDAVLPTERLTIELRYRPITDADGPDDASEGDADDDRQLIFTIEGPSWVERRASLAHAISPWAVTP